MKLASLFAVFAVSAVSAVAGCGSKAKPAQLAPLPEDPKPAAGAAAEAKPAEATPAEPAEPPAPAGPYEVKIAAPSTSVKLVSKGRGKLAPLRYAPKAGAAQPIELALDFASIEEAGPQKNETAIPTIVLRGDATATEVAADGRAAWAIAVTGTDARDVPGSRLKAEEMKTMLASLVGMSIAGSFGADGAAGETTLRVEKPDRLTPGALEIVRLTLPPPPLLPAQPIGVGAKWQTKTETKLADKIAVTVVTDYELVSAKAGAYAIKGKTTVTGADQELNDGKITAIKGAGTSELTLVAGAAYPAFKSSLETSFTASAQGQSMTLTLRAGGASGAPAAPQAAAAMPAKP